MAERRPLINQLREALKKRYNIKRSFAPITQFPEYFADKNALMTMEAFEPNEKGQAAVGITSVDRSGVPFSVYPINASDKTKRHERIHQGQYKLKLPRQEIFDKVFPWVSEALKWQLGPHYDEELPAYWGESELSNYPMANRPGRQDTMNKYLDILNIATNQSAEPYEMQISPDILRNYINNVRPNKSLPLLKVPQIPPDLVKPYYDKYNALSRE